MGTPVNCLPCARAHRYVDSAISATSNSNSRTIRRKMLVTGDTSICSMLNADDVIVPSFRGVVCP